jgi:hypothetical protein
MVFGEVNLPFKRSFSYEQVTCVELHDHVAAMDVCAFTDVDLFDASARFGDYGKLKSLRQSGHRIQVGTGAGS